MEKSPFKFLDSYKQEDKDIFFGRVAESEELYERTFESNIIVLFGASGTGKTSLINCGLGNLMQSTDWLPIMVRRESDLLMNLKQALKTASKKEWNKGVSLVEMIRSLYLDYFKPIYLILDQFEEIFILGKKKEQITFFKALQELLVTEQPVKVLISIRDEYFAVLSDYEVLIPDLLRNKMRIERMTWVGLEEVILGTLEAFNIRISPKEETVRLVLEQLQDKKQGIELAHLQIYLDKLYRNASNEHPSNGEITFSPELVKETKPWIDVLGDFLAEQLEQLEYEMVEEQGLDSGIPRRILLRLVTDEGTKKRLDIGDLQDSLRSTKVDRDTLMYCIDRLVSLRLIRLLDD